MTLKKELADGEHRTSQAIRARDEALEKVAGAKYERERLLDKLIQAERIRQAGSEDEGLDLASFIAELRAEVLSLRAAMNAPGQAAPARPAASFQPRPVPAPPPAGGFGAQSTAAVAPPPVHAAPRTGFRSTEDAARALAAEGRLGIGAPEMDALKVSARFDTRTQETLFALSLRELSARDPRARLRAAQRLKTLGARAASPAVAASLNAEETPEVAAALLEVLAASGDGAVLPLVRPHLTSGAEDVRLAALDACFRLRDAGVLRAAMSDTSPRLRRRAAILASGTPCDESREVLALATVDEESSVRRVGVLGTASLGGPSANASLLAALDDADLTVRRAAAKGLSGGYGPEVFAIADLEPARRKREIRRLAQLPAPPLAAPADPRPDAALQAFQPGFELPAPEAAVAEPAEAWTAPAAAAPVFAEPAVAAAAVPEPVIAPAAVDALAALKAEIVSRVYAALRGQSLDDLTRGLRDEAPDAISLATVALEQGGRLVRRGQRYFVP